jgi:hypothetical protein
MLNWADLNINITVSLDPAPTAQASFTVPLIIGDIALAGTERVRSYVSPSDAVADQTAGEISEYVKNAVLAAFSQTPRPALVKVGRFINGTDASYAAAYSAIKAVDEGFYSVSIDSRAAADIVSIVPLVEADYKVFIAQTNNDDLLTTGFPAALAVANNKERTALLYHDATTEPADFAWAANRLVFDPDNQSAPWDCEIFAVAGYDSALTATQANFGRANNTNMIAPFGPASTFVDSGINTKGRPLYEIVTADWFAIRLQESIAFEKVKYSARGQKIVIGPEGQAVLQGLVETLFAQGTSGISPHFIEGQTEITFPTITQADLNAQRIRANVRATLAVSGRVFNFNVNFTRENIFSVEVAP